MHFSLKCKGFVCDLAEQSRALKTVLGLKELGVWRSWTELGFGGMSYEGSAGIERVNILCWFLYRWDWKELKFSVDFISLGLKRVKLLCWFHIGFRKRGFCPQCTDCVRTPPRVKLQRRCWHPSSKLWVLFLLRTSERSRIQASRDSRGPNF